MFQLDPTWVGMYRVASLVAKTGDRPDILLIGKMQDKI